MKNNCQGVIVEGLDNILIRFAKCCNPLPGDEIIGYITKGRGVAVHRKDCTNFQKENELFKNRLIKVSWANAENGRFEGEVQIKAADRRGIINDITHTVAVEKVGLNGINARKSKDEIVNINLLIEVKKIKAIPGVEEIYRVNN